MTSPTSNILNTVGTGGTSSKTFVEIFLPRDPTPQDLNGGGGPYQVQQRWWNTASNDEWVLVGFSSSTGVVTANWQEVNQGPSNVAKFLPDTGVTPVVPDADGQVKVHGQTVASTSGIQVVGALNELDIQMFSPFTGGTTTPNNGDFIFRTSTAGTAQVFQVVQSDNTNSASHSQLQIACGGNSGGDPFLNWLVSGSNNYCMGVDNSDANALTISTGSLPGQTNLWHMTPVGQRTMPLQPAFSAFLTAPATNVTGDGTIYVITGYTQVQQQGTGFNLTTGVFTAPVAGWYLFTCQITLTNLDSNCNVSSTGFNSSTEDFFGQLNPGAIRDATNQLSITLSQIIYMGSSDTIHLETAIGISTKTVGVYGDSTTNAQVTKFTGALLF